MTGDPEVWLQTWIEATATLLEVDEAPPETCDFCLNAFEAAKEAFRVWQYPSEARLEALNSSYRPPKLGLRPLPD